MRARDKLSDHEIDLIRRWIEQGAQWQTHWSFIPPKRPPLAAGARRRIGRAMPIDSFVLARLEREGLNPSPEADRRTLIRRVTLDLTGLPPTPAEVDAFLHDASPDAYEKVVDRLLASPRYGERMAFRWMEAARYADTNGYQTDGEREMWRWRDWVIDAFNRNMPFDQFTIEQIAGDLLPNATLDQMIATGFNRNHRTNAEGGIVPEEFRVEYVADRAETTSTVWLGLTSAARAATITNTIPSCRRISTSCSPTSTTCRKRGWSTTSATTSRTSRRRRRSSSSSCGRWTRRLAGASAAADDALRAAADRRPHSARLGAQDRARASDWH